MENDIISIVVNFRIQGFHCWPNAPEEYEYLRNVHRHEFHIKVKHPVDHKDRDIEIIEFKNICIDIFNDEFEREDGMCYFGAMSCEQIADWLCSELCDNGYYPSEIEVLEDGENGALIEFN